MSGIFAAHAAFQFREVVLSAQVVALFLFLSFFLHTVFVRAASFYLMLSLRSTWATMTIRPAPYIPTVIKRCSEIE